MRATVSFLLIAALLLLPGSPVQAAALADDLRERVLTDLKATLHGDIELQEVRFMPPLDPAVLGEYRITQIAQSGYAGKNRINYLVSLKNSAGQSFSLLAEAVYDVFVDIMVTARAVQKGATLTPHDYNVIRQRSSRLPVGAFVSTDEVNGKIARMNLTEGLVLKREHVLSSGYINRGHKVRVEIESGSILVTANGVLRSGGTVGSSVKVYCTSSKREIQGLLIAPDLVRVKS